MTVAATQNEAQLFQ